MPNCAINVEGDEGDARTNNMFTFRKMSLRFYTLRITYIVFIDVNIAIVFDMACNTKLPPDPEFLLRYG